MKYRIRNWSQFQHYKDRNPPWIKLHQDLMSSETWALAPSDADRIVLVVVMLLAARNDNKITSNTNYIKKFAHLDCDVNLNWLLECAFIEEIEEGAEDWKSPWPSRYVPEETRQAVLARDKHACVFCSATKNLEIDHIIPVSKEGTSQVDNLQVLCRSCNRKKRTRVANATRSVAGATTKEVLRNPEAEAEREKEKERVRANKELIRTAMEVYNRVAEDVGWQVAKRLTPARQSSLKQRLDDCGGIEEWSALMTKAGKSSFLTGKTARNGGHENWRPGLDFFLRQSSFTKLMEGQYDDPSKPPSGDGGGPVALSSGELPEPPIPPSEG